MNTKTHKNETAAQGQNVRKLPAYEVIYADGTSYVTSMSKQTTLDDARRYFIGASIEQPDGSCKGVVDVKPANAAAAPDAPRGHWETVYIDGGESIRWVEQPQSGKITHTPEAYCGRCHSLVDGGTVHNCSQWDISQFEQALDQAETQRDELLAALRKIGAGGWSGTEASEIANAAIAREEGRAQ